MSGVPRIYALGNAPMTSLLAFEVAQFPMQPKIPQVVLLLNDQKKMTRFLDNDSKFSLRHTPSQVAWQTRFMASCVPPVYSNGDIATMENLVVGERDKKSFTRSLHKYQESISVDSNVLLLDMPTGGIESIYKKVWPNAMDRPHLFMGMSEQAGNTSFESEFGIKTNLEQITLKVCPIPAQLSKYNHKEGTEAIHKAMEHSPLLRLLRKMAHTFETNGRVPFNLVCLSYGELLLYRLERLMVQSCTEPLTIILNCKYNNELLAIPDLDKIIWNLLKEQIHIILVSYPFIKTVPNHQTALDIERIFQLVKREISKKTKNQSTLQLKSLNKTSLNQLSRHFVMLAHYKGVKCPWNELVSSLARAQVTLTRLHALDYHYL